MIGHSSQRNWLGFAIAMIGSLGVLSFMFAAASMITVSSPVWFLAVWGDLMFRSLHVAGLYIPAFLIVMGFLLFTGKATLNNLGIMSLGFIPAVAAGITLNLMFMHDAPSAPLPGLLASALTLEGAVVVCASVALISLIGLFQLGVLWSKNGISKDEDDDQPADRRSTQSAATGSPLFKPEEEGSDMSGESASTADAAPGPFAAQSREQFARRSEADQGSAIDDFRSAMNGKLENKIRGSVREYTDIDAPLKKAEARNLWKEEHEEDGEERETVRPGDSPDYSPNPLAEKIAKGALPDYKPRRPMFFSDDEPEDDSYLEVYFGKDGNISDYPPSNRKSWVTQADEVEDSVHSRTQPESQTDERRTRDESPESIPAPQHHVATNTPQTQPQQGADTSELHTDSYDAAPTAQGAGGTNPAGHSGAHEAAYPAPAHPSAGSPGESPAASVEDAEIEVDTEADTETEAETEAEADPYAEPESENNGPNEDLLPPISADRQTWDEEGSYNVPIRGILDEPQNKEYWLIDAETTRAANTLKATLEEFGIVAEVTGIRKGPVITMFEILPAPGVKLARIVNLSDNIALRLAAQSVRIVAPIPGKHAVGIEIPNRDRAVVSFSELLRAEGFSSPKVEIPVALGKDITGDAQIVDLARTPHLLIAGATGSGKSVCVNALICSILYRKTPAEVNMILIDPKIVELKFYNDIPHLLTPVITDPKKAFQALQWCLYEMERRYSLLDAMQVRDIKSYNKKIKAKHIATPKLPYLVIVIDEFADLMATSGKELEGTLARLAAMSRAVGIHLVLATQRPSTDVITGLIKANVPSRIAFMVASKIDSRIIIDSMGAEKLLGKGDMLFTSAWDPFPFRMQGAFLSDDEVERIVAHVKKLGKPDYIDDEIFFEEDEEEGPGGEDYEGGEDPLMKEAIDIVVSAKKASASYLQRRLKIGYNRAARMVEEMEEMGIVGPQNGSKAREILRMFQ